MIKTVNVEKFYKGGIRALDGVSIDIEKGEFVFIVGPSGSGKSTFMKLLTKEEDPTAGEVYVAGKNLSSLPGWRVPYLRRNVGCVFQDFKLLPNETVFENVAFALEVIGRPKQVVKRQVPQILELVGLGEKLDRFPDELSGGEQQRVAVARALANDPMLLLADEPTGNLDERATRGIYDLFRAINAAGTAILLATHDTDLIRHSSGSRILELDHGSLVYDSERED